MKRKVFRILASGVLSAALLAGPAVAENPEIRVGSYKGSVLETGERSCLIIGPSGTEYEASSSAPEVVALERVLTYWVAVAKTEGTAEITVTNKAGNAGILTLTVGPSSAEFSQDDALDLSVNMEIRLEMVRLINDVRRENGLAELHTNEALMNAAQDVSSQCVKEHRPYDHKALARYGWPYGALYNLTVFTAYGCPDIAKQAVTYWLESTGHYETMLSEGSHVGTGVTFKNGRAYCYMVMGNPASCNPYT
jgi:uncharacterized protein YkwD